MVTYPCAPARTSSRRTRRWRRSAGSARGPPATSRCARSAGPMRFSKAISACCARSARRVRRGRASAARRGGRGARMPSCICGGDWAKPATHNRNDEETRMKDMKTHTSAAVEAKRATLPRARVPTRRMTSPLGEIVLVADEDGNALTGIYFARQKHFPANTADWRDARETPLLHQAEAQLHEYFAGGRTTF